MPRNDLRRHSRRPFVARIRVAWQDQWRADKSAFTQSFDISEGGLRFELPEPISMRAGVTLRCDKIGLQTRGIVRNCARKGAKYVIGVEFAGSYRWQPPSEEIRVALEEAELLAV